MAVVWLDLPGARCHPERRGSRRTLRRTRLPRQVAFTVFNIRLFAQQEIVSRYEWDRRLGAPIKSRR
jgi:hypothetical protein